MEVREAKRRLRPTIVASILALDPDRRRRQEAALIDRVGSLPGFGEAASVLLYVSALPEEIDTRGLMSRALGSGKRLILPRVDRPARRLRLHRVEDIERDLSPGVFGIPEPRPDRPETPPDQVDWALVPGLAFDRRGFRLGRGAGYYDRLLPTLRPEVRRWALALDPQWVEAVPVEPHDQPLDGIAGVAFTITRNQEIPPDSPGL